jgi:phosphopantothenate---cysteine ligase (CTP)
MQAPIASPRRTKVIVTCGPSFEPLDQVRRLTNFSTGELGVCLSEALADAGFDVLCFKGSGATFPGPYQGCAVQLFNTNDDLLKLLWETSQTDEFGAIFHAAALCDYKVKSATDENGKAPTSQKIPSREGTLTLTLEPATKLLPKLRALFPASKLVGWKYELDGSREAAIAKAMRQIDECNTDACVVNGAAFGAGFGFCQPGVPVQEASSKGQLTRVLTRWLANTA